MTKITDDKFIEAWHKFQSPEAVSKALSLDLRATYRRRSNIEARHGIVLNTAETRVERPKISVPKEGYRALADIRGVVLVGSDGHFWPGERSVAFDAFIKLTGLLKPSAIIMNGDSFDGAKISRHPPGGWAELPDVADELAAVQERHGEIEAAAPQGIPLIWPAGNHDSRFTARLASHASEYVRVRGMDIADHFPAWQFCWSVWINSNTVVKHRWHSGIHGAHANTLKSGKNMVTGHTHRLQATMHADYNGHRWGVECGTLSEFGPRNDKFAYGEDSPHSWGMGFAVLTFDDDGSLLEPEFCRVIQGKAYFRGKAVA